LVIRRFPGIRDSEGVSLTGSDLTGPGQAGHKAAQVTRAAHLDHLKPTS
jgi:hypothetical protein